MKKMLLVFALFYFGIANSQINNLKELMELSRLSVYGLTQELQYVWEISRPTERYSEDKKSIIGRYTYTISKDNKNQVLQRQITMHQESGYTSESTSFVSNDMNLLNLIVKNLPYQGFEVKQKKLHKTVYHDGTNMIAILDSETDEDVLSKGYYKIVVFVH